MVGRKTATGPVVAMRETGDDEIEGSGTHRLRSADEIACGAEWPSRSETVFWLV